MALDRRVVSRNEVRCKNCGGRTFTAVHSVVKLLGEQVEYTDLACTVCGQPVDVD